MQILLSGLIFLQIFVSNDDIKFLASVVLYE